MSNLVIDKPGRYRTLCGEVAVVFCEYDQLWSCPDGDSLPDECDYIKRFLGVVKSYKKM